ncbi:unnamed protein product, partial [Ectocarpus sp. 8 AP-2014]
EGGWVCLCTISPRPCLFLVIRVLNDGGWHVHEVGGGGLEYFQTLYEEKRRVVVFLSSFERLAVGLVVSGRVVGLCCRR